MTATRETVPAVLLVDDDIDHALIAQRVLHDLDPDLPVAVATTPEACAQRIGDLPPAALVLLDRMLQGRDVIRLLLPSVRSARPDLTFVVMSAALSDADRERALHEGAVAAIEKPGRLAEWRELFATLLNGGDRTAVA
jgi:CheY-like chemotaxis protein